MTKRKFSQDQNNRNRSRNRNRGNKAFRNFEQKERGVENNTANSNRPANNILPPPHILQEYEYATDGAARRIIAMAEAEQKRRHDLDNEYLQYYKKSLRIGQIFGFLIMLVAIGAVVILSKMGHYDVAEVLAVSSFSAVFATTAIARVAFMKHRR